MKWIRAGHDSCPICRAVVQREELRPFHETIPRKEQQQQDQSQSESSTSFSIRTETEERESMNENSHSGVLLEEEDLEKKLQH